jgi:myosin heavy subunit
MKSMKVMIAVVLLMGGTLGASNNASRVGTSASSSPSTSSNSSPASSPQSPLTPASKTAASFLSDLLSTGSDRVGKQDVTQALSRMTPEELQAFKATVSNNKKAKAATKTKALEIIDKQILIKENIDQKDLINQHQAAINTHSALIRQHEETLQDKLNQLNQKQQEITRLNTELTNKTSELGSAQATSAEKDAQLQEKLAQVQQLEADIRAKQAVLQKGSLEKAQLLEELNGAIQANNANIQAKEAALQKSTQELKRFEKPNAATKIQARVRGNKGREKFAKEQQKALASDPILLEAAGEMTGLLQDSGSFDHEREILANAFSQFQKTPNNTTRVELIKAITAADAVMEANNLINEGDKGLTRARDLQSRLNQAKIDPVTKENFKAKWEALIAAKGTLSLNPTPENKQALEQALNEFNQVADPIKNKLDAQPQTFTQKAKEFFADKNNQAQIGGSIAGGGLSLAATTATAAGSYAATKSMLRKNPRYQREQKRRQLLKAMGQEKLVDVRYPVLIGAKDRHTRMAAKAA